MNIIYNKYTGVIDRAISDDQNYKSYYSFFPKEFVDTLDSLPYEGMPPTPLSDYYVENLELKKYPDEILEEKKKYGKILTEEEKLDILLQPSHEEVTKAKAMLEMLPLLEEMKLWA